jgi:hypothetical protein
VSAGLVFLDVGFWNVATLADMPSLQKSTLAQVFQLVFLALVVAMTAFSLR